MTATILLVEDDPSNVILVEDVFEFDDVPARLVSVASGEEAIRLAEELQPALILMDLRLPGIDGIQTTRALKKSPRTKHIPVWAITAYVMQGDEEHARGAGCDVYLPKPTSSRELAQRLREHLSGLQQPTHDQCAGQPS